MKLFIALLGLAVTSVLSQEILEVTCGQDAIVARFNEQTAESAGYAMEELHFNDPDCLFDGEQDGYYVKRVEPLSSCGTDVTVNDTHAVFSNSISSGQIETGLTFRHGIIVGQPDNQNLISVSYQCTYKIDLRLSAAFIPNITYVSIPIPDAIGEGFFQVAMAIYKDATYRDFYDPEGEAPTLQPDETVYVGITMIDDTSSDVYILMRRCWATPGEVPTSEPFYDLIANSCPIDGAVEGSVTVTQNGVGHQALWQTSVFRFVGEGDEFKTVWLHCDLTICIGEPCEPTCSARRRRRSAAGGEKQYVVSYGPLIRSKHTEIHFGPEGQATIIVSNDTDIHEPGKLNEAERNASNGISDHTLVIAIGAFAAFCMLCLSMALVIVLMRLKRSGHSPAGEVTQTGTINKGFSI